MLCYISSCGRALLKARLMGRIATDLYDTFSCKHPLRITSRLERYYWGLLVME